MLIMGDLLIINYKTGNISMRCDLVNFKNPPKLDLLLL